jgi:hypothetical protein
VQGAAPTLDDEVFTVDAMQGTLQAGKRVPSVLGGPVAEMLAAIGRVHGEPLTRLPAGLQPLAEEAGIVTQGEVGAPIPANLPASGGPRSMNDLQAAQALRTDAHLADGRTETLVREIATARGQGFSRTGRKGGWGPGSQPGLQADISTDRWA